jgi:hypothetical protein
MMPVNIPYFPTLSDVHFASASSDLMSPSQLRASDQQRCEIPSLRTALQQMFDAAG